MNGDEIVQPRAEGERVGEKGTKARRQEGKNEDGWLNIAPFSGRSPSGEIGHQAYVSRFLRVLVDVQ